MQKIEVKHVQFTDTVQENQYKEWLRKQLDAAFRDLKPLNEKRGEWIKQYEGRMAPSGPRASWQIEFDAPLSRELIQAATARLVNPVIEPDKVMSSKPRHPDMADFSTSVEDYLDYAFDKFDTQQLFDMCAETAAVQGIAIVKLPQVEEVKVIKDWVQAPVQQVVQDPFSGMPKIVQSLQWKEITIEDKIVHGAIPQLVNPSDFLYPPTASDPKFCQWMGDQYYLCEYDVKKRMKQQKMQDGSVKQGEWYDVFPQIQRAEIDPVTKVREELGNIEPKEDRYLFVDVYVTYDVDGDGVDEEIITTINWPSCTIVKNIYNYYHNFRKPYIFFFWRRRPNSMESLSACYTLYPMHKAYSALMMMNLDSAALASKGWMLLTTDQLLVNFWKGNKFTLGDCVKVSQLPKDNSQVLQFGQPQSNALELMALIREHAQTALSINLYNLGQEQTQRPTASGQTLLVEEGKQPLKSQLQRFREFISEIGMGILYRAKQFYQNDVEYFQYSGNQLIPKFLQFPIGLIEDKIIVEPTATTATMNEQVRRQEIVALADRMNQSYAQIMQILQMAEQAAMQGSANGMVYAGFAQGMINVTDRLLQEFKIPKRQELLPPVDLLQNEAQQYVQVIQQLQQNIMQLQQVIQQMVQMAQDHENNQANEKEPPESFGTPGISGGQ